MCACLAVWCGCVSVFMAELSGLAEGSIVDIGRKQLPMSWLTTFFFPADFHIQLFGTDESLNGKSYLTLGISPFSRLSLKEELIWTILLNRGTPSSCMLIFHLTCRCSCFPIRYSKATGRATASCFKSWHLLLWAISSVSCLPMSPVVDVPLFDDSPSPLQLSMSIRSSPEAGSGTSTALIRWGTCVI